ncbi:MAG: L,D-transpeptidase [Leptolyngbyaceae cyanobacterium bins.302]|nr:L,D-transpeptidase [Leptolyngbyaceae cyanobacterium bins.302]
MAVKQILKPLTHVLSVTWLIWLYSNTSIFSIANLAPRERSSVLATLQPLQSGLDSISSLPQRIEPLLNPPASVEPDQARLEVHLRQRRVVLFRGNTELRSYPIAIGQAGWETPSGQFKVLQMQRNPNWIHPLTNQRIPNDDLRNPLGRYWIGFWTDGTIWIGFHGTPHPNSVGQALSHGCLRMHDTDIDEVYYQVSTGTPVTVKP